VRAVIIADTHLSDGSRRTLDEDLLAAIAAADAVLHAGDVTGQELLDRLGELTTVHAVLGNNDVTLRHRLPEQLTVELGGVRVGMVHDAGPRAGRPPRLARRFPDADLVVFGHSHQPEDLAPDAGPRIFNPGSPTQRRRAPTRTFGILDATGGRIESLRHVHLSSG
jgi:putative phosphoesterase